MAARTLTVSINLLPVLIAVLIGAWLLSTRFLSSYLVDSLPELSYLAFQWFALPAFIWSAVLSVFHLLRVRTHARRAWVAIPFVLNLLVAVAFVMPAPFIDQMDFQRHFVARTEIVQRIERGELWNGSPSISLASLPHQDYPTSVSNGAGQHDVVVYREDGVLHVVFYPVTNSLVDPRSAVLFRSDGQTPSVPNRVLPDAVSSERLDDNWHRITFAAPAPFFYAGLLQTLLVLMVGSSIVVIPLALGARHLARRALRPGG